MAKRKNRMRLRSAVEVVEDVASDIVLSVGSSGLPGSSRVELPQRRTVAQHDAARVRQLDRILVLEAAQRARDRLDGEAEVVGDVLARHRQLDRVAARAPCRHLEQEADHALLRSLDQQEQMLLDTGQLA